MDEVYCLIMTSSVDRLKVSCGSGEFWVPKNKIKDGYFFENKYDGTNQILEIDSEFCVDEGIY